MSGTPTWVAVDWGTSNLRAWVMDAANTVLHAVGSDEGMGTLDADGFEPALTRLLANILPDAPGPLPVIACGMVGARQGWVEAPYVATPCRPPGAGQAVQAPVHMAKLDVRILPGVKQANPPDVMRGEETQIAGFLAQDPEFDGVLCLPGTHTKWVHISAGEIVSFRTYMTGEIFALLSRQSVLRFSVDAQGWDQPAFQDAVADAMGAPQKLASRLFGLRADTLLNGTAGTTTRARLSGALMGAELAAARDYWLGRDVVVIGDPNLSRLYQDALIPTGTPIRVLDGADLSLVGLTAAFSEMTR